MLLAGNHMREESHLGQIPGTITSSDTLLSMAPSMECSAPVERGWMVAQKGEETPAATLYYFQEWGVWYQRSLDLWHVGQRHLTEPSQLPAPVGHRRAHTAFGMLLSQGRSVEGCTPKLFSTGKSQAGNKPSVWKSKYLTPSWLNKGLF